MNICLHKYNSFLSEASALGLMMTDHFSSKDQQTHMSKHCFSAFYDGTKYSNLENIIYPVIQVDDEFSPVHQINDVVIGAIQHSLKELQHNFLPILKDNFWRKDDKGYESIMERGFNVYPKKPATPQSQARIKILEAKFQRLINRV